MALRDLSPARPWQQPATGRFSLLRKLRAHVAAAIRPGKPALANLAKMPFTVVGYGAITYGAYLASHVAAWFTAGVLLIVLEYQSADE